MMQNMRLSNTHSYEPKQRIVGGIVLFLLMFLLYVVLKALLGISSSGKDYAFDRPLPEENAQEGTAGVEDVDDAAAETDKPHFKYPVIKEFIFLALDGQPMDGQAHPVETIEDADLSEVSGDKKWVVQVASLDRRSYANALVKKLADNQLEAVVKRSGRWHVVSLKPQTDKRVAEQQLQQLRSIGIKGLLRSK